MNAILPLDVIYIILINTHSIQHNLHHVCKLWYKILVIDETEWLKKTIHKIRCVWDDLEKQRTSYLNDSQSIKHNPDTCINTKMIEYLNRVLGDLSSLRDNCKQNNEMQKFGNYIGRLLHNDYLYTDQHLLHYIEQHNNPIYYRKFQSLSTDDNDNRTLTSSLWCINGILKNDHQYDDINDRLYQNETTQMLYVKRKDLTLPTIYIGSFYINHILHYINQNKGYTLWYKNFHYNDINLLFTEFDHCYTLMILPSNKRLLLPYKTNKNYDDFYTTPCVYASAPADKETRELIKCKSYTSKHTHRKNDYNNRLVLMKSIILHYDTYNVFDDTVVNEHIDRDHDYDKDNLQEVKKTSSPYDDDLYWCYNDKECLRLKEVNILMSVTTFIKSLFPVFDTDEVIKKCKEYKPEYKNMTTSEIKRKWEHTAKAASEHGTYMHNNIEKYYNDIQYEDHHKEYSLFKEFEEEFVKKKGLRIYRTEWRIYSESLLLCGSIDAVYEYVDNSIFNDGKKHIVVVDFKFIKELKKFNPYESGIKQSTYNMGNCNYIHYCIQLSIYKYIIDHDYGDYYHVDSLYDILLHGNQQHYIAEEVKYNDNMMDMIMKERKKDLYDDYTFNMNINRMNHDINNTDKKRQCGYNNNNAVNKKIKVS